jgi:hypothetical protein
VRPTVTAPQSRQGAAVRWSTREPPPFGNSVGAVKPNACRGIVRACHRNGRSSLMRHEATLLSGQVAKPSRSWFSADRRWSPAGVTSPIFSARFQEAIGAAIWIPMNFEPSSIELAHAHRSTTSSHSARTIQLRAHHRSRSQPWRAPASGGIRGKRKDLNVEGTDRLHDHAPDQVLRARSLQSCEHGKLCNLFSPIIGWRACVTMSAGT